MDEFNEYRSWKSWDKDEFGRYDAVEATYFAAELAKAGIRSGASLSLLEIGFGNGHLAGWVRAEGWSYIGTELDPELVARAREASFAVHEADVPLETIAGGPGTVDVVVAFDVLEHLEMDSMVALLKEVRRCLKPDGCFIARFPSGDSPFAGAIQNGDITHRSIIGSGIVRQLGLRTGFRIEQMRAPVFPIWGLGIRRALRRGAIKCSRVLMGRFLQLVFFDNQSSVVEPNMLIVLRPTTDNGVNW